MLRIVDALYAAKVYEPDEMLEAARRGGHNPYRAHFGTCRVVLEDGSLGQVEFAGEILCGHNPYLVARVARVWRNLDANDGSVGWEDLPRPTLDLRASDLRRAADPEPAADD